MLTTILLGFLLIAANTADCPLPKEQQTQILSDSIEISAQGSNNEGKQDLTFNYKFQETFSENPSVSFGINEFVSGESPMMEIRIENPKVKTDGVYFRVQSSDESKWKSLKLNFISTTRKDLEFGTASFTNPTDQDTTNEVFDVEYPLQNDFSSIGLKVKPFIQSFSLESKDKQTVGVKLQNANIEEKKVYFSFANPKRVSLVRSLTLSIIVFNIYTPGVLYADGIIDQNFVTSKTEIHIPRHGISELRTYIVGINSFHASTSQPVSISSAIDETFTLVIGPIDRQEIDFVSVSYLILSIIDCGSCAGYPVLYKGICKLECPFGYVEKNGKCVPIDCSEGFELGPEGECVPECEANQEYSTEISRCVCIDGYYPIAGVCTQCFVGTIYNFRTMTCDSLCDLNSVFVNGVCICNPGYYSIDKKCQSCPKGTLFDNQSKTCKSICSPIQVFNGQKCVCASGYHNISGSCDKCPLQTIFNDLFGICECLDGKQWNSGLNSCVEVCTPFEELEGKVCICKNPYIRIEGVCGSCPRHSIYFFDDQKCYCKYGFRMVDNQCLCPKDEIFDETEQRCIERCPKLNEIWQNNQCICPQDYERNENGTCYPPCGVFEERINGKCTCINGYYKGVYGPCVPIKCPPGFKWEPIRRECRSVCAGHNEVLIDGECVCVMGFERDINHGICMPGCPSNQVRVNGVCQCSPGNKIIDGVCTNCPKYTQYVNGICLCYNGNPPIDGQCQELSCPDINHVYDSITRTCKCKGPLSWVRGRCEYIKGCGENEYWCGTHCKCHYGYVREHGKCVRSTATIPKCPPYSTFDIVSYSCVCHQGYHPVRPYVCQKCPDNTHWDGFKCNDNRHNSPDDKYCAQGYIYDLFTASCIFDATTGCGPNEYYDAPHCRCKLGYFVIEGACQKCPYGTFFDGLSCNDVHVQTCEDPYKFWNGRECVCQPEFFEYGNTCVRCPANTEWNGICCKVPLPFVAELKVVNGY